MTAPMPQPLGPAQPAGALDAWSAGTMAGLVIAEVRKAFSTAAWWALLASSSVLTLLYALAAAKTGDIFSATSETMFANAINSVATLFAVVFGVVVASAEFRHRTVTTSYLTAPGRPQLLVAKVVVAAAMGALYALAGAVCALLGMLLGEARVDSGAVATMIGLTGAAVVVCALWAVFGVGIGTLTGNQLAAIIGVLLYLWLVEKMLVIIAAITDLGRIGDYLPGGAAEATLTRLAGNSGLLDGFLLSSASPWWVALLVFAGWTAVAVLAGAAAAQRRDIT